MSHKDKFVRYLADVRKVNERTIAHYKGAIDTISTELFSIGEIETSIFLINNPKIVSELKDLYWSFPDLKDKDDRGNRMYSAALNRYWEYFEASNEGMKSEQSKLKKLINVNRIVDKPREKKNNKSIQFREEITRDAQVSSNSLINADFKCEFDENHYYFDSKSTGRSYVEAHHLIPMSRYDDFTNNIDVEANVISLCLVCHRKLHHGKYEEKVEILTDLFRSRETRLNNAGVHIFLDELLKFYY